MVPLLDQEWVWNCTGWWLTYLKNDGVRQLGWWHSQYMEKIKMFQPTNQCRKSLCLWGNMRSQSSKLGCDSRGSMWQEPVQGHRQFVKAAPMEHNYHSSMGWMKWLKLTQGKVYGRPCVCSTIQIALGCEFSVTPGQLQSCRAQDDQHWTEEGEGQKYWDCGIREQTPACEHTEAKSGGIFRATTIPGCRMQWRVRSLYPNVS